MYTYRVSRVTRHEDATGRVTQTLDFLGFVTARDNLEVGERAHEAFPGEKHLQMVVARNFVPVRKQARRTFAD